MTSESAPGSREADTHSPDELEKAIGDYLDALNSGRTLDPREILAENPRLGPRILESLEEFLDLGNTP